jgi:hypothetical protein
VELFTRAQERKIEIRINIARDIREEIKERGTIGRRYNRGINNGGI